MESCSLEELKEHFEFKIEQLTKCMDLAAEVIGQGAPKDECREQLVAINSELCLAESAVGQLREHMRTQRRQFEEAKEAKDQLAELLSHVRYVGTNLPDRLPGKKPQMHQVALNEQPKNRQPLIEKPPNNGANQVQSTNGHPTIKGLHTKHHVPQVDYLTVDEFNQVPKYMKGRLSYDSINNMIDGINLTLTTKYCLMHKSLSALSQTKKTKYYKYKEQENKNTKDLYFFIDEDFKTYSKVKYDNAARSIITILRHSGRLREIRGGGFTRFVIN